MRVQWSVYLWWQLRLIQYQYEGPVTAMLVWKRRYWNESSIVRLSLVTTLIDSVPIWRSSDCQVSLKEEILKWELNGPSISGDNFDRFSTNMKVQWLPCKPERGDIEMRALLFVYLWWQLWLIQYQYGGPVTAMLAWKRRYWNESSMVRLSLVTTLIDSVPIWRSSDCHVSLKEGILKWELNGPSISGDNFDWFSTNMEVKWLPC